MPAALLPSAEALVVAFLRAQPAVMAIVGNRISTRIPDAPTWPLIRVRRVGGTPQATWEDAPRVQIECWADVGQDVAADDLSRAVISVLVDAGYRVGGAGYLAVAVPVLGPLPLYDPDTDRPRYIVDVSCLTYA